MCFSATASFVTGGVLTLGGKLTSERVKNKREIPFAIIPLLLGIQQITEGVVWLTFNSYPTIHLLTTYIYAIFSHVWWPIYFPVSLLLLEKNPLQKKSLLLTTTIGLAVGLTLLYLISFYSVTSGIHSHSVAYYSYYPHPWILLAGYVLAVCGSALFSSYKIINQFGVMLFISFVISKMFFDAAFFSVWCFFAAILSVFIFIHMNLMHGRDRRGSNPRPSP